MWKFLRSVHEFLVDCWDFIRGEILDVAIIAMLFASIFLFASGLNKMSQRIEVLESEPIVPAQKACLDYTLRDYREGETPEKCAAEVYGDQFTGEEV